MIYVLCKADWWYKGKIIYYFNIKPYTTSFFMFLSINLIQVDSGQITTNLIVLHLNTLLK